MITMSKRGETRKSYNPLNGTTADDIYFDPNRAEKRTKLSGEKGLSVQIFSRSNTIWFFNKVSVNGTASVSYCRYKQDPKGKETYFKLDTFDADGEYFKGKPHWIPNELGFEWTEKAIEKAYNSNDTNEKKYAEEVLKNILSYGSTSPNLIALKNRFLQQSDSSENP